MHHHTRDILLLATAILSSLIVNLSPLYAAGPKWLKTASKSLVQVYAVQPQGDTLLANGFFTSEEGTLLAPFKAIRQARSAWVEDVQGKRYDVARILGFNATYDVVRLQADGIKKKVTCLPTAAERLAQGDVVYLMPTATADTVAQVEKADSHAYYTLRSTAAPPLAGLPVINSLGQAVALLQTPVATGKAPNYALDVQFALSLGIKAFDANTPELRQCGIPQQLPAEEEQAVSFIYLARTAGNPLCAAYAEDFIRQFPTSPTGYITKAELQAEGGAYDEAWQTYGTGLEQAAQADELLHARSKAVYEAALKATPQLPEAWTLENALTDIAAARAANPLPLYTLHEGNVRFALKQYAEAYDCYMALAQTKMRSPEAFTYAWQCKQNMGAPQEELLALNDSALACFSKPYNAAAAPYLLLRSNMLTEMGRLREAIGDLGDYEHLMQGQLTAQFYYRREQLEARTRMFGQAVNDIHKAISLDEGEPVFHAELAVLLFRLNDLDNAIGECRKAIALDAEFPDAHRLLGICLREKGDLSGARQELNRAVELGDELAKDILEKMEN